MRIINIPKVVSDPEARHAVLVIGDDRVPEHALRSQCIVLAREGLRVRSCRIDEPCRHCDAVERHAEPCNACLATWRTDPRIATVQVLLLCRFASPLRWLPRWLTADAAHVCLLGPQGDRNGGCPDDLAPDRLLPNDFFDSVNALNEGQAGFRPLYPDNGSEALAFRRYADARRGFDRIWSFSCHRDGICDPRHACDLPLITSNLPFDEWTETFGTAGRTAA